MNSLTTSSVRSNREYRDPEYLYYIIEKKLKANNINWNNLHMNNDPCNNNVGTIIQTLNLNEQIQWCMNNDNKCKEIANNARQFVKEKLNWEQVKNDMINIFTVKYRY